MHRAGGHACDVRGPEAASFVGVLRRVSGAHCRTKAHVHKSGQPSPSPVPGWPLGGHGVGPSYPNSESNSPVGCYGRLLSPPWAQLLRPLPASVCTTPSHCQQQGTVGGDALLVAGVSRRAHLQEHAARIPDRGDPLPCLQKGGQQRGRLIRPGGKLRVLC